MNRQQSTPEQGPQIPAEIVFALDDVGLAQLAANAQAHARVDLRGVSEVAGQGLQLQERRFSFDTSLLLGSGAQISPLEGGAGWLVSGVDPIIFFPRSPDFRGALGITGQSSLGFPPESVKPHWLPEFPASLAVVLNRPLEIISGWQRLPNDEIAEKTAGLAERYPHRELLPLLTSVDSDDVVCLERGRGDRLVVIHDFSSAGLEESAVFDSPAQFAATMDTELAAKYHAALLSMLDDQRYVRGINWGAARPGHPEGTIAAHISELTENLRAIMGDLSQVEYEKAQIFIHAHDTFKGEAEKGARILDPKSHASLARSFVETRLGETALSAVIQYHDELYALWRGEVRNGSLDSDRYNTLVEKISDWDTFVTTKLVDSITSGKDIAPTVWALKLIESDERIKLSFDPWQRLNKILASRGMDTIEI